MVALTLECPCFQQPTANLHQLIDGVYLPCQVVQTRTLTSRDRSDPEQPEVVVVIGSTRPEEHRPPIRCLLDGFETEYLAVERGTSLGIGDVQDRMVEASNVRHHFRLRRWTRAPKFRDTMP